MTDDLKPAIKIHNIPDSAKRSGGIGKVIK
jgi:hypothetical protein